MNISERVEKYRALKGYSQRELAEKIGITKGGYNLMVKNNSFKTDVLEKIAEELEVSIVSLVTDIDVNKETLRKLGNDLNNLADSL